MQWAGLDFSLDQFNSVIAIGQEDLKAELKLHTELFEQLAHHLPKELLDTRAKIEKRMNA